jgi:hypothetical protein
MTMVLDAISEITDEAWRDLLSPVVEELPLKKQFGDGHVCVLCKNIHKRCCWEAWNCLNK